MRIYGKQNYMNMKNHRLGCNTICAKYMCCEKVENMKYTLLNVKYFVDVMIQKKYYHVFNLLWARWSFSDYNGSTAYGSRIHMESASLTFA